MLNQPTFDKLCAMRLRGLAEALQQQMQEPDIHRLSFEERLALLIDRQWDWRQNRALERRLRNARLQGPACIEDIDYRTPRGLDRAVVRSLHTAHARAGECPPPDRKGGQLQINGASCADAEDGRMADGRIQGGRLHRAAFRRRGRRWRRMHDDRIDWWRWRSG